MDGMKYSITAFKSAIEDGIEFKKVDDVVSKFALLLIYDATNNLEFIESGQFQIYISGLIEKQQPNQSVDRIGIVNKPGIIEVHNMLNVDIPRENHLIFFADDVVVQIYTIDELYQQYKDSTEDERNSIKRYITDKRDEEDQMIRDEIKEDEAKLKVKNKNTIDDKIKINETTKSIVKKDNNLKAYFSLFLLIGIPSALFYYFNTYYIGLSIVYFALAIAGIIFLSMFFADVASGVAIFPILIIVGIGYAIMQFGDKEKGIIFDRTLQPPTEMVIIPRGQY